ncbi:MAG TPA: type II secretion system F family protein, partial [Nitrospirota bacterium]|nr:type II secretion system F family protein [Nitrospirota bacterium]
MAQYTYKARDKNGTLHEGIMEARGREAVADQLSSQGFIPVLIEEQKQSLFKTEIFRDLGRVKLQDLIVFSRQLATLLSAG